MCGGEESPGGPHHLVQAGRQSDQHGAGRTGLHLQQTAHRTESPLRYWRGLLLHRGVSLDSPRSCYSWLQVPERRVRDRLEGDGAGGGQDDGLAGGGSPHRLQHLLGQGQNNFSQKVFKSNNDKIGTLISADPIETEVFADSFTAV